MTKQEYRGYLNSKKWLLKKHELISVYLNNGWKINCNFCGLENNLQVHHTSYRNIGNEILIDERIWELVFTCRDCHQKWHFEQGFKDNWLKESINNLFV